MIGKTGTSLCEVPVFCLGGVFLKIKADVDFILLENPFRG